MENDAIPVFKGDISKLFRKEKKGYCSFTISDGVRFSQSHLVNRTCYDVVALCDGCRSIESIAETLAEKYSIEKGRTLHDVKRVLPELARTGLLRFKNLRWNPRTSLVKRLGGNILALCSHDGIVALSEFLLQPHLREFDFCVFDDTAYARQLPYEGGVSGPLSFVLVNGVGDVFATVCFQVSLLENGHGRFTDISLCKIIVEQEDLIRGINDIFANSVILLKEALEKRNSLIHIRIWLPSKKQTNEIRSVIYDLGFVHEGYLGLGADEIIEVLSLNV